MSVAKLKVVMGNLGLDGHEIGALTVASALRDAGMEVIYLGLCQTPASVVATSIQEDADLIGVSSMSGVHDELIPELVRLVAAQAGRPIPVIAGGIIPPEDVPPLLAVGVKAVFGPGTPTADIVRFIQSLDLSRSRRGGLPG